MKKLLFVVCVSMLTSTSFSQATKVQSKKKPFLAINFMMNDFRTADRIKNGSLSAVFRDKSWSNFKQMSPGLSLSYFEGLTNNLDFMATLGGSFADYSFRNKTNTGSASSASNFLLEADANINVKLLSDNYIVNPYFTTGVGASLYRSSYGAYIPFGVGVQFKLSEESFLFTNVQYRVGITDKSSNHFNYSLGFAAPLFGGGDK